MKQVEGAQGTPVTEDLAREYRRVLLLKEPCFYNRRLTAEELAELLSTPPRPYNGVNLWLFGMLDVYEAFMKRLAAGEVDCAGIFPRRR